MTSYKIITKLSPLRAVCTTSTSTFSTLLGKPATNCRSFDDNLHIFLKHRHQNETQNLGGKLQNVHPMVHFSPPGGKILGINRYDDDANDDEEEKTEYRTIWNGVQHHLLQLQPQRRMYHATACSERAAAVVMGLATISALGYAGFSAINSFNEWKASQPTKEGLEEMRKEEEKDPQKEDQRKTEEESKQQKQNSDSDQPRKNIFHEWFDVGTKYYEGGFEDSMTKREAALVLGIRESASPARVKDAHRKLLILNHPDTGGSTFLAGKLNEAKELLLKGKSQRKK